MIRHSGEAINGSVTSNGVLHLVQPGATDFHFLCIVENVSLGKNGKLATARGYPQSCIGNRCYYMPRLVYSQYKPNISRVNMPIAGKRDFQNDIEEKFAVF